MEKLYQFLGRYPTISVHYTVQYAVQYTVQYTV